MALKILRVFEYSIECDICGDSDVLHTGDAPEVDGIGIYVHDTATAIKAFEYHRTKQGLICNKCFGRLKEGSAE